ncbi:unnamed protein product [Rhizophagus irregularis]|nr:unnamed protein product [Rhizophagus irregularis]CAB5366581.1 unnamed protein product [Rhizophagus irregularis]
MICDTREKILIALVKRGKKSGLHRFNPLTSASIVGLECWEKACFNVSCCLTLFPSQINSYNTDYTEIKQIQVQRKLLMD